MVGIEAAAPRSSCCYLSCRPAGLLQLSRPLAPDPVSGILCRFPSSSFHPAGSRPSPNLAPRQISCRRVYLPGGEGYPEVGSVLCRSAGPHLLLLVCALAVRCCSSGRRLRLFSSLLPRSALPVLFLCSRSRPPCLHEQVLLPDRRLGPGLLLVDRVSLVKKRAKKKTVATWWFCSCCYMMLLATAASPTRVLLAAACYLVVACTAQLLIACSAPARPARVLLLFSSS